MDFTTELYAAAGLAAAALGAGVLLREPRRPRNRLFALLCAALATWTLGSAASGVFGGPRTWWSHLSLLGAFAAPPFALHFAVILARPTARAWHASIAAAYAAAAGLWALSFTPLRDHRLAWAACSLVVLGGTLGSTLALVGRHVRSLHPRQRRAFRLVLAAGFVAAVLGLSDLVPRAGSGVPRVGGAGVLLLLLVVSVALARHRFLDMDALLARVLALLAGAAAASLLLHQVARRSDGPFPLFLATLLVLGLAGPVGRSLLSGARSLLASDDVVARALFDVSRKLPAARSTAEAWRVLDEGRQALPGDVSVALWSRRGADDPFRVAYRAGPGDESPPVPPTAALPRLLQDMRAPVTRALLEEEAAHGPPARRDACARALDELTRSGADVVAPLLRGDGLAGWIAIGGGLSREQVSGEVATAFLAVANQAVASLDRLEALEAARRAAALAAVGEMAAGLAHEVRNPLGAIRGAAQVLEDTKDPAQATEMLEVIRDETERLGRVVGDFLDYARPSSPRREPVDLGALVESVLRADRIAGCGMHAEVRVADGTPPALGDAEQVRRAVANLVRNAREAAGPTGLLEVDVRGDGAGRVSARFQDDGPGIPPDEVAKLFQPFHTTKPSGTGLGLALVHRVVEAHGGTVSVEPRPGLGAAFTLTLPAASRVEDRASGDGV